MTTSSRIIAVTGATGQQGGATARELLARGFRVRALTRNPAAPAATGLSALGAELVRADFDDLPSLAAAFEGASGVFSVQGFWDVGVEAELRHGRQVAEMAKRAGVRHLVYASVGGAERASGVPHFESKWQIEQHIHALDLPATILRPVEFMENFNWSRGAILGGTVMSQGLRPERKKYLIAVEDIGVFAAIAFSEPERYIGRALEIAGDALTEAEIAATMGRVLGRSVRLTPLENPSSGGVRDELLHMWRWFDEEGYRSDLDALREIHPDLLTLEAWLRRNGWG